MGNYARAAGQKLVIFRTCSDDGCVHGTQKRGIRMLQIVTFNLRCVWDRDGVNSFVHRAGGIIEKVRAQSPDIICFQEATEQNVSFLKAALTDYYIIYSQREQGWSGEGLATAYRRDRLNLQTMDCFWLSPTPRVPGSRFANQSMCSRICQTMLFKDLLTGRMLRTYNVHLDHISDEARVQGIRCVLERIAGDTAEAALPFFLMGDFNAEPESETMRFCNAAQNPPMTELTAGIEATFHAFGRLEKPEKIDYIYADAATARELIAVDCWEDCLNGIYLSDHYPVAVRLKW